MFRLRSHRLCERLLPGDYDPLTSAPRIAARATLNPKGNLVDLEHQQLRVLMLADDQSAKLNVRRWWESAAALTAAEQRNAPFRASEAQQTFVLLPDGDHAAGWRWQMLQDDGRLLPSDSRFNAKPIRSIGQRTQIWNAADYLPTLLVLAEQEGIEPESAARSYGTIQLPATTSRSSTNASTWEFDQALGLHRNRD